MTARGVLFAMVPSMQSTIPEIQTAALAIIKNLTRGMGTLRDVRG